MTSTEEKKRPQCHECQHDRKEHRPMAHSPLMWCPQCYRRCMHLFPPASTTTGRGAT